MKMSYKIALIVSVLAVVLAVIMFTGNGEPTDSENATTADATPNEPVEPRKSLRSETTPDAAARSQASKPETTPATRPNGNSLSQAVRDRMQAIQKNQPEPVDSVSEPDKTAEPTAAVTDEVVAPVENTKPDAIALTRTDSPTPSQFTDAADASGSPVPMISEADLDAILGDTTVTPTTAGTESASADTSASDNATSSSKPTSTTGGFAGGTYKIQAGDTLSSIAKKFYGDVSKWDVISQANFVDPINLKVGQELRIPALADVPADDDKTDTPLPVGVKTYTIRPGDSLSTVAEIHYKDPTLWRVIYNYNRKAIGDNPNAIQAGMTIKVPPRVVGAR